jgi:hypothetical protein
VFEAELARAGWRVDTKQEVKRGASNIQYMYACSHAA